MWVQSIEPFKLQKPYEKNDVQKWRKYGGGLVFQNFYKMAGGTDTLKRTVPFSREDVAPVGLEFELFEFEEIETEC